MKRTQTSGSSDTSESASSRGFGTELDERLLDAVTEAITESNDKVVEIRPAERSGGGGRFPLALLFAGALVAVYWLRSAENSSEAVRTATHGIADRTELVSERTAERIQAGGETLADRVEERSQRVGETIEEKSRRAGETIEEKSQKAGEAVEEGGETAAERATAAGEEAADGGGDNDDGDDIGSSGR